MAHSCRIVVGRIAGQRVTIDSCGDDERGFFDFHDDVKKLRIKESKVRNNFDGVFPRAFCGVDRVMSPDEFVSSSLQRVKST